MIHELTKELYRAAHERGYIINLKCEAMTNGTGYVNLVLELYSVKEASHVMTLDLVIGDKKPESKELENNLIITNMEIHMDKLDFNISLNIQTWVRSAVMKVLGESTDVLFGPERELNENQCVINSILIIDTASVEDDMHMDFDGDVVFPKMEYTFTIGHFGRTILRIDYECVSDALERKTNGGDGVIAPKLIYNAYSGSLLNELLKLGGLTLTDPNGVSNFDKKLEILMTRMVARTMQPLYDEIYKTYQRVKIGGSNETKEN